ncbi:MAG: arabinan endo-1,5-alpha-L-arabinosidase, partial [Bacteroidetes bacterium]|nr:arabinan endo-1,5-alpha-L-arabinosidase [Bacteroidota bacterium]
MKRPVPFILLSLFVVSITAGSQMNQKSGNPVFPGWYADPEGIIFNKTYWIYPT